MSLRAQQHAGFTLVELLTVVGIIGVIAMISMPYYAEYKAETVDAEMAATLHSARNAIEGHFVDAGTYSGANSESLREHGLRHPRSVDVVVESATATAYVLRTCSGGGTAPSFRFDSESGELAPDDADC